MNNQTEYSTENIFLSYISHRVRTPLNSVIGFSKLLMNRRMDEDKTQQFAERILDSGYELLFYFQNIMDLSELESGTVVMTPEEFDMKEFVNSILAEFSDRFRTNENIEVRAADFDQEKPCIVYTDEFLFKRIFTNLLELTRNYISQGSIQINYLKTDKNELKIYVRGIPTSGFTNIDKDYFLGNPYDDQNQDNIEYLTYKVTKKLCEVLNGSFRLENRDNKEILFSFTLTQ